MQPSPQQLLRIGQAAARLRLAFPKVGPDAIAAIQCGGYTLPLDFVWFCSCYSAHEGWPHNGWPGLFSPFGAPSALEIHNRARRQDANWPTHLVAFSGTDNGDYCFDFHLSGAIQIVYFDDWANQPTEDDGANVIAHAVAKSFADWFSDQVDWLLERGKWPG